MPGRVKCGGTEEEIVVAHCSRKSKKLICGQEEEIVVAHGRLPSPARLWPVHILLLLFSLTVGSYYKHDRNKLSLPYILV